MSLNQIKELRSRTGCGIVDCKEALSEANDNIDAAIEYLRKKGITKAAKKADRATHEGAIASYVHTNGKLGVLVTVYCETDFVAKNEKFLELANNIALHVAAMNPAAVNPEDIPAEDIAAEEKLANEQASESGKPAEIQAKMVEGKMKKYREERALLTQPYVKDPNQTIADLVQAAISELGENISVGEISYLAI